MATCKQTAFELIQDVFAPCIAVLCSSDVEQICAKNNLTFVQMIQPFCRLNTEVTIRDPGNLSCVIKNFRFTMKHLHAQPPSPTVGKKMMHDAVASNISAPDGLLMNSLSTDNYFLKYCSATPWFESYRDVFFQVTSSPEHEFVHNYIACICVVSSSHQDPLSQINELSQELTQYQNTHSSRWFFSYVFQYYLLVHDVSSEDLAKAETVFQSMKSSFGATTCHLLQINSAQNTNHIKESNDGAMPDPWSQFLSKYYMQNNITNSYSGEDDSADITNDEETAVIGDSVPDPAKDTNCIPHPLLYNSESNPLANEPLIENASDDNTSGLSYVNKPKNSKLQRHGSCLTHSDMDRIKCFVQDFCIQGLIPFIEKRVRMLSEQVANRKGIHRTLFGVTKKLFGNKPGAQSSTSLNSVVYGPDAPELQVRKLGDLAFMFQLYEVAYQAYHSAKRDFNADQAWLHFAGASEMAALSVFMQNSNVHEYPMHYIESAITTYLQTCKLPDLATRATFLSTECLKAKGLYSEAAAQFVRMPSDADLTSALCLEQAAYCYVNCKPPKVRKYAFHVILAGHRFSKSGQRKHALRSYKQAEQVYRSMFWNFANNHINFTIGRLSVQLDQLESACTAFEPLLVSKCQLPALEQANYLKEYLFVMKKLITQKPTKDLPVLPVPLICSDATKVLLTEDIPSTEDGPLYVAGRGFDRGDINNNVWGKLEEIVVLRVSGNPILYNQLQCFTNKTDNTSRPNAIAGERISIEVVLKNPLSVPLTLEDVYPLWIFIPEQDTSNNIEETPIRNEPGHIQSGITCVETKVIGRIIIEPHQESKICLLLTPKQVGSLVITGIAYNLMTLKPQDLDLSYESSSEDPLTLQSLQGKRCFDIKGPRLNKSAEERALPAYAEDNRLNFNILSPMAKLQVKFQSFPYTLFCGEIQKCTAELTNIGQHRLHRIFMASPRPGLFAIGNPREDSDTILKEVSSAKRPTPVIAKWGCDWMTEVLMSDGDPCTLDPGGSVTIPVWFKGPETPGDHDLDILFYYESEPPNAKLRYRLLQLSSVLVTHPAVCVQSCAMRSFCNEENFTSFHPATIPCSLIMSVEVGNISKELDQVSLVQISCISEDWCFRPSDDNYCKGLSVICSNESLMLTLKAIGFDPKATVSSSQNVRVFSRIPMGRVEVDNSSVPCIDFSQKSGLDLTSVLSEDQDLKTAPSVKQCDRLRIEKEVVLLLVIVWKAKFHRNGTDHIIIGLHHTPIYSLEPSTVELKTPSIEQSEDIVLEPEETESDQPQSIVPSDVTAMAMLKCSLTHPFLVKHDFKTKRVVLVPVEFTALSMSSTDLSIIIDNSSHIESIDQNYGQTEKKFSWVNGSKKEMLIKSNGSGRLKLQAMFCEPGTYNLDNLNILVNSGKEGMLNYNLPSHLIIISS